MISFTRTSSAKELEQIIALQKINLPVNLEEHEVKDQGFVTVQHTLELLTAMHNKAQHVIAKDDDKVIGYALVMHVDFRNDVQALVSLFDQLENATYKGENVMDINFFVMGQICVSKEYRGQGIFEGMYQHMKYQLSPTYDAVITSIAKRNTRSCRAHQKVGFEVFHEFISETGEDWNVVIWNW